MIRLAIYLAIAVAQVLLLTLAIVLGSWLLGAELSTHTILPWRV